MTSISLNSNLRLVDIYVTEFFWYLQFQKLIMYEKRIMYDDIFKLLYPL